MKFNSYPSPTDLKVRKQGGAKPKVVKPKVRRLPPKSPCAPRKIKTRSSDITSPLSPIPPLPPRGRKRKAINFTPVAPVPNFNEYFEEIMQAQDTATAITALAKQLTALSVKLEPFRGGLNESVDDFIKDFKAYKTITGRNEDDAKQILKSHLKDKITGRRK